MPEITRETIEQKRQWAKEGYGSGSDGEREWSAILDLAEAQLKLTNKGDREQ